MNLLDWFRKPSSADREVRAEIWRLGARHHGWPLEGALSELEDPDRRARAVVARLRAETEGAAGMTRPTKLGGPPYRPATHGGLSDPRSTGAAAAAPPRPVLNDRRSTR